MSEKSRRRPSSRPTNLITLQASLPAPVPAPQFVSPPTPLRLTLAAADTSPTARTAPPPPPDAAGTWAERHLPGVGRIRIQLETPRLSSWTTRQIASFNPATETRHFAALDPGTHLRVLAAPPAPEERPEASPPPRPARPRVDPRHDFSRRRSSLLVRAILAGPDDAVGGQRRPSRCVARPARRAS